MFYALNQKKYNALLGLAYRVADNAYMIERYGAEETAIEREQNTKTVSLLFDQLDKMKVPFWVQNTALAFGENWRRYKTENLSSWLESRKIDCSFVSCI